MQVFGVLQDGDNSTSLGWMGSYAVGQTTKMKVNGVLTDVVAGEIDRKKEPLLRLFAVHAELVAEALSHLHPSERDRYKQMSNEAKHLLSTGKIHVQFFRKA